jgi:hypothetical protein
LTRFLPLGAVVALQSIFYFSGAASRWERRSFLFNNSL